MKGYTTWSTTDEERSTIESNGGRRAGVSAGSSACVRDVAKVDGSESWIHGHSVTVLEHVQLNSTGVPFTATTSTRECGTPTTASASSTDQCVPRICRNRDPRRNGGRKSLR